MSLPFRDRHDAGRQLAEMLVHRYGSTPQVLALPRGGVPVAYEIAHALHAPLDTFLVRHLELPGCTDTVLGVVGSGGVRVLDRDLVERMHIPPHAVDAISRQERIALIARERAYRGAATYPDLRDRDVILVDDGVSDVGVVADALRALREHDPARITLALPIVSRRDAQQLAPLTDELLDVVMATTVEAPERWYLDFMPVTNGEVRALLNLAAAETAARELLAPA